MTAVLALVAPVLIACGGGTRRFPLRDPMWKDDDQKPFAQKPEEYESQLAWDGIDHTIFRPVSRFFAVDPGGESINVNALDEVPDSSWFENRIAKLGKDDFAEGACKGRPKLLATGKWTVINAKPNGANPGFMMKTQEGRKYLVKFETDQLERASTADAFGARAYHAVGYATPCNTVVFMKPDILVIDKEAKTTVAGGKKVPLTQEALDKIFKAAAKSPDGSYRASASELFDDKPIGPWQYHSTRDDDPNDVVPHDDRRDVRAGRVLASWLNHHDAREQNTLALWVEDKQTKQGWVRHALLDWGDCFGGLWDWDALSRRIGHAYYLDFGYVLEDFVTLGIPRRPWDDVSFGKAGDVLGYYDVEHFEPEKWHVGYPNPAFGRMTERDGAWMARIMAHFDDEKVDAIVDAAQVKNAVTSSELRRILKGRRDKILQRWLSKVSPLGDVEYVASNEPKVCFRDYVVFAKLGKPAERKYAVRAWVGDALEEVEMPTATSPTQGKICTVLPKVKNASPQSPAYVIVDVVAVGPGFEHKAPARAHLYQLGATDYRLVGLERPDDTTPPKP